MVQRSSLPDNANVWRPPAATALILTPGPRFTKQGGNVNVSSPEVVLSISCLADDIFLRLEISSPYFLSLVCVEFEL